MIVDCIIYKPLIKLAMVTYGANSQRATFQHCIDFHGTVQRLVVSHGGLANCILLCLGISSFWWICGWLR